jgi:predicted kinase
MEKILVIVRGIPGSGKTSFADDMSENGKYPVFSADMFFEKDGKYNFDGSKLGLAHEWCQGMVKSNMAIGKEKIFVANTFTTEEEIKPYMEMAKRNNYKVYSIIVENRHGNSNIHNVPDEIITKMKGRFSTSI